MQAETTANITSRDNAQEPNVTQSTNTQQGSAHATPTLSNLHTTGTLAASTIPSTGQQSQDPWRPTKADLAKILCGFVPDSVYGRGLPATASGLFEHILKVCPGSIPGWYWTEEESEARQEDLVEADIGFGPPYRASYPGMNCDQVEDYLRSRMEPTRISEGEAQRHLMEARQLLEVVAKFKDDAVLRGVSFADVAPGDEWLHENVTKMKAALRKIQSCADHTYLNAHVGTVTRHALCALYEGRMEVVIPFTIGHPQVRSRQAAAAGHLAQAYKDLEDVAKIMDKAVSKGWTFAKASPSAGWLKTRYGESSRPRYQYDENPSHEKPFTHFETLVGLMTYKAWDALLDVYAQGRGYKPASFEIEARRSNAPLEGSDDGDSPY